MQKFLAVVNLLQTTVTMVLGASILFPVAFFLSSATALDPQTYDYVVVGGGTSGVTIASRLAQSAQSVALIEAGDYYEKSFPYAGIPGADGVPIGSDPATNVSVDWGFVTAPQAGANDREIHFARGKCLGGSSALNFMVYQRSVVQPILRVLYIHVDFCMQTHKTVYGQICRRRGQ